MQSEWKIMTWERKTEKGRKMRQQMKVVAEGEMCWYNLIEERTA